MFSRFLRSRGMGARRPRGRLPFSPDLALLCLSSVLIARGDASVPGASDKSPYTLFDPTPDSLLRDMDTDRPNVTNTPHTIDAGHMQLEAGLVDYSYYRYESGRENLREDDLGLGQFNLRIGVSNSLELNAVVDTYEALRTRDYTVATASTRSGFGDVTLGGKLNLWGNDDDAVGATAFAIQPQFKLPTAGSGLGNGRFELSVAAPFLVSLPAGFHLGLQPGITHERDSANSAYLTGFPGSISVDRMIVGNLDVYVEYAFEATTQRHSVVPQTFDVGGTYPLTKNIVADTGLCFGLNRATNTLEVLAGISVRR